MRFNAAPGLPCKLASPYDVRYKVQMTIQDDERERRLGLWEPVKGLGPDTVPARSLRDLGVYGGAQGVWVDKVRTGHLALNGVTVGLLHTGRHYLTMSQKTA
jgi:hypothetical protein